MPLGFLYIFLGLHSMPKHIPSLHLHKNGVYYIRRRIPADVRSYYPISKKEISRSLNTKDHSKATIEHRLADVRVDRAAQTASQTGRGSDTEAAFSRQKDIDRDHRRDVRQLRSVQLSWRRKPARA